jgi:hypothetical protein
MPGEDLQTKLRGPGVMLQLAVLLKFESAEGARSIQVFTSIVNAHGGILESPINVVVNQKITLENPKTGLSADCRVVRADRHNKEAFAVAFEFEKPSNQFWPIFFPSEDCTEDSAAEEK